MTLMDILFQVLIYGCITAGITAWLLYRRLMGGVRSAVRVHFVGGTEKRFDAVEIGEELVWIQGKEEMRATIPEIVQPGNDEIYGIHYRVYDIIHGADEVMQVPWHMPDDWTQYVQGDAAAKQRYRNRVNALNVFKQLAAGLSTINRWQAGGLIVLGLFIGLYFSPIIQGAIP